MPFDRSELIEKVGAVISAMQALKKTIHDLRPQVTDVLPLDDDIKRYSDWQIRLKAASEAGE